MPTRRLVSFLSIMTVCIAIAGDNKSMVDVSTIMVFLPLALKPGLTKGVAVPHVYVSAFGSNNEHDTCEALTAVGVSEWYGYLSILPECAGIRGHPMLWNGLVQEVNDTGCILGPNEPDLPGQSNLTPYVMAERWRNIEQAFPGRCLVGPATSSVQYQIDWRNEYVARYGHAPRMDALAMHCYSSSSVDNAVAYCQDRAMAFVHQARQWGINRVWITEIGLLSFSGMEQAEFIMRFMDWARTIPEIEKVFPFCLTSNKRESWSFGSVTPMTHHFGSGEMTALGVAYAER